MRDMVVILQSLYPVDGDAGNNFILLYLFLRICNRQEQ